jgi:hypothetical protein
LTRPPPPSGFAPSRRRGDARTQGGRAARALLWALAALVLIAGAVLAALTWGPNLARDRIAAYFSGVLGRELAIGHIDVSPFAGIIVLDEVSLASAEPGRPTARLKRFTVGIDPWSPLTGVIVIREVKLDAPALRLVRTAPDRLDVMEIAERFANRPASTRKTDWRVDRITIADGRVDLEDRVVGKATALTGLALQAEGLTNQDAHVERPATLAATLAVDGRPATLEARATPFAPRPVYGGALTLDALPVDALRPYLVLPPDIGAIAGSVSFDLGATWRAGLKPAEALDIEGRVSLDGLTVHDAAGAERLAASSLAVALAASQPLGGAVHVTELRLRAPKATLGRAADGRLDWPRAETAGSAAAAAAPAATAPPPKTGPRSLRIDRIRIDDGTIAWSDAALAAPLALRVAPLTVAFDGIEVPDLAMPATLRGTGTVAATVDGDATLTAALELAGAAGRARAELARIDVSRFAPLAGPALRVAVEQGRLAARATVDWQTGEAPSWSVSDAAAELTGVAVTRDGRRPAAFDALTVSGVAVDPATRRVDIAAAKLSGATLQARRGPDGRIDLLDWWQPVAVPADAAPDAVPVAKASSPQGGAPSAPPPGTRWSLALARAEIAAFELDYDDRLIAKTRKLPRARIDAIVTNVTTDPSARLPFEASVALADGSRLAARGALRPVPLDLDAQLRLQRFSVTHVEPYLAPYVNVALASGQLWSSGRLRLTGAPGGGIARIGWDGEFSANEFRAIDAASGDDFLRWSALALPSVKVDWKPDRVADSLIEIGQVAFVDFYARIILGPDGRLNLSRVLVDPDDPDRARSLTAAPASGSPAAAARARPSGEGPTTADREREVTTGAAPDLRRDDGARSATIAGAGGPRPTVRVGTVRIASGNVAFTDLFIRPNYSANLTQLVGSIGAIASDQTAPSDVLITGRVDDDTPLEITGLVNPLSPRSFIELRAVARGFDLPKLSPYSGRWAGYAIEKGKLTADVRYRIDGTQLSAENRLTINQLTFGDKVESPDATSLPVRFAVSLLKDRNGNIDLDLPISGTVTDPQFSVGGLLWKAIGNLVVKVVTSPFTFLASLAGGDAAAELSHVEFPPGGATLDDEDRKRLDALAQALEQRPGLSVEIAGFGDPRSDRDAMQRERLERTLKSAKLAAMRRANPGAELPSLAELALEEAERPALLVQAWVDAKLDAGTAGKAPAPEEIERLLLERAAVATEEVRQVAQQRAQVARDYLRDRRGITNDRLYLLAPRVAEPGDPLPPRRADFAVK